MRYLGVSSQAIRLDFCYKEMVLMADIVHRSLNSWKLVEAWSLMEEEVFLYVILGTRSRN